MRTCALRSARSGELALSATIARCPTCRRMSTNVDYCRLMSTKCRLMSTNRPACVDETRLWCNMYRTPSPFAPPSAFCRQVQRVRLRSLPQPKTVRERSKDTFQHDRKDTSICTQSQHSRVNWTCQQQERVSVFSIVDCLRWHCLMGLAI